VSTVKERVAGQAYVTEVDASYAVADDGGDFPPPPDADLLRKLSALSTGGGDSPPPLPARTGRSSSASANGIFTAKPYNVGGHSLGPPPPPPSLTSRPTANGSTASSLGSSRNGTPSPNGQTGSTESTSGPSFLGKRASGPRCEECREWLQPGAVAVQADRAGKGKMWHPQCFKCSVCHEMLADLLYYYDQGSVFCARHYAEHARIPRCAACDELIFAPEYTGAEDKTWHIRHFCCYLCDRPLAGHKYIPVDGQPHCLLCYRKHYGKVCRACGEYIAPEDQRISLDGQHWHARAECFRCGVCGQSLLGKKMGKREGMVVCSSVCGRKAKDLVGNNRKTSIMSSTTTLTSSSNGTLV